MSSTDDLLQNAHRFESGFIDRGLPAEPARKVAIVACMDARLNPYGIFGLSEGDAHVIRNAGGGITDDTIRSLTISQRLLGTKEVVILQHTGCGMTSFTDEAFRSQIEAETGTRPRWHSGAFSDLDENLRASIHAVADNQFLAYHAVRGFVFDVTTGVLREVLLSPPIS